MLLQSLRASPQFQIIYRKGTRYNGCYVTVFVARNDYEYDRFGITTSRKTAKNAVDRNRMKRLIREGIKFSILEQRKDKAIHYDWILNAKRSLMGVKLLALSEELKRIVIEIDGEQHLTGIKAVETSTPHQPKNI